MAAADDDSLESTIMMAPPEPDVLAKASSAGTENRSEGYEANGKEVESDLAATLAGDEFPIAAEENKTDSAADEVPVPSLLSDFGRTEGNIAPSSTAEFSAGEIQDSPERPEQEGDRGEKVVSETEAAESSAPSEPVSFESEEDAPALAATADALKPSSLSNFNLNEGVVSLPEQATEVQSNTSDQASTGESPNVPESGATVAGPGEEKPVSDTAAEPVEGIDKPVDDLSAFDSYQSQSMFDSVRIMEPRISDKPEDIDTRLNPVGGQLDSPVTTADQDSGNVDQGGAERAVSSTSHNIGLGDTDGKKSAKLKPLTEGTILNGRYEIIRKIGGGGMGAVYLASDNNLGGVLRAVKEMVQTHIEEEQQEKAISDFKRESMILSSLDHVSIPTIYDYFYDEKESRFYLVMKYISGGDLSSRLRAAPEGKIDEKSVCEWAVQIIDVLDYLHSQPSTIVYRDLKPSNIMIDGNSGRAMLIDFGIARSISQKEEKGVTAVGTMGYAPPELFSGNVEPRSDIYSLGSTMFHLLTGADPQSNPLLIFDFQKNPRPRQINPQLSDQIERIIMKAVQYNADQRYGSAAEMRAVLEDHLLKLKAGIVTYGVGEVPPSVSLANQSVFCGFCGQRIVATDMFCAFCGAKQPIAQQGVHAEIYSQAAWTAKLVIEGTSELTAPAFSLQKDDNLLGRRDPMSNIFPEVDLSKYDPQTKISRRHARIWREGNNFLVEDLGSSNGTILSRSAAESFRLAPKQPQILAAGDRLRLGDATLHFIIG